MTTDSAEHRTATAAEALAEYVAKCNEIIEIELVIVYLDTSIAEALKGANPVAAIRNAITTIHTTDAFWQLVDLYREADNRRLNLYAARDYAYAVWVSASAELPSTDTYVSTPQRKGHH